MRHLKRLGVAALMTMAVAYSGTGSASATELCEGLATTNCGSHVASGSNLVFGAESNILLTGPFGELFFGCNESWFEFKTSNTNGAVISGNLAKLTFESCGTRTVTANKATLGNLSITHIDQTDNGTVRSNDTTLTVTNIPLFGTCRFLTNNTDIGTLKGIWPFPPTLAVVSSIPSENGCPNGVLEGTYVYAGATDFNVSSS